MRPQPTRERLAHAVALRAAKREQVRKDQADIISLNAEIAALLDNYVGERGVRSLVRP